MKWEQILLPACSI